MYRKKETRMIMILISKWTASSRNKLDQFLSLKFIIIFFKIELNDKI